MDNIELGDNSCLLNLPEPILDCILKLLSPMELVGMSEVCTCLRKKCRSDHLWEVHIKKKWGGIIGDVVYKEWQWHITRAKEKGIKQLNQHINENGSLGCFSGTWPMLYLRSYLEDCNHLNSSLANSFMMALYLSLQNGKFWFPAQIYREYMVCDALISYDSKVDNFQARVQNAGWHVMGNITWDTLRVPPVDTPPWVRHVSDCLQDLKPGDHIEIQWRQRIDLPYDWWYAVIGHMESCNDNSDCRCLYSETLIVEFKQYSHASNMRGFKLLRNREQSEEHGYGGIRKLHSEEIQRWEDLLLLHQTPFYYCHSGAILEWVDGGPDHYHYFHNEGKCCGPRRILCFRLAALNYFCATKCRVKLKSCFTHYYEIIAFRSKSCVGL